MNAPRFHRRLVRLVLPALLSLVVSSALAEPPANPHENANKNPPSARSKPQVIYHLPPSSAYAATLHSQAKRPGNSLPIDSSMPTSLQMSRAAANSAAEAQPEQAPSSNSSESENASVRKRVVKSKATSSHTPARSRPSVKSKAPAIHADKSHKK
jgi:hypothetical protein